MRRLVTICILLAGMGSLAAVGSAALTYKPFSTAPDLVPAPEAVRPRLGPGRAAGIEVLDQESLRPYMAAITRGVPTPPLTETDNYLLAGIHSRPWAHGGRTDPMLVLVMHRKSGHVGLVSIPRDMLVVVPGEDPNRINTVYASGVRAGGPDEGVRRLKGVIRHTLGLDIAQVLFVDHAGFEGVVDQLGGVSVQVICPIHDRFIDPRGPGGKLELKLDTGVHHMDGRTVLMFVRSRHGRGLAERARRQQGVLMALRERARALGARRIRALIPAVQKTLFTDMQAGQILRLLGRAGKVKPEHIHGLSIGRKQAKPVTMADGKWVMIPDADAISAALSGLFASGPPGHRDPQTCPEMDAAFKARAEHAAKKGKGRRKARKN